MAAPTLVYKKEVCPLLKTLKKSAHYQLVQQNISVPSQPWGSENREQNFAEHSHAVTFGAQKPFKASHSLGILRGRWCLPTTATAKQMTNHCPFSPQNTQFIWGVVAVGCSLFVLAALSVARAIQPTSSATGDSNVDQEGVRYTSPSLYSRTQSFTFRPPC